MPVAVFDIFNNLSISSWGVVAGSIFAVLLSGVIFWKDTTKQSRKFLFLFGIVNASAALAYVFFEGSLGTPVVYIGMIMLYITSGIVPVFLLLKYNFEEIKVIAIELFISITVLVLTLELFLASSFLDLFIKTAVAVMVVFASSFLAESVKREIRSKDQIARLSHNLEMTSQRLKILDKKKSEFFSTMSHRLRDQLTAIKGYALMLADGSFGELSKPTQEAVEKISASSGHLATMISDFVDISRIESGEIKYNFTDVDVKNLVLDVAKEMKQSADRAHLVLSVTVDDNVPLGKFITIGDEGKLRQVISSLIDNSIKYTPLGEISLLLSVSPDYKKILFSLSDTGIGISPLTLEKIFKKFSVVGGANNARTEGAGLGLYVANEIIKKHEGRIWAESKGEGTGSTFFVELEVKP